MGNETAQTLVEKFDETVLTNFGVRNIRLSVLKRFKTFALSEAENDYAKAIELLLERQESLVLASLENMSLRLSRLEEQWADLQAKKEDNNGKPTILRFGGGKQE